MHGEKIEETSRTWKDSRKKGATGLKTIANPGAEGRMKKGTKRTKKMNGKLQLRLHRTIAGSREDSQATGTHGSASEIPHKC